MAWISVFLVAATALLALKGTAIIQLGQVEEPEALRIALAKWPPYDLLHLAQELGYFEEEGVLVELEEFSTQGDCRRAFERGQVDSMSASSLELVMASEFSKRNPKAFVVIDESLGGDALVTAKRVRSLSDLAGKRIGAESGTVNILLLHEALNQAGLFASQVEIVNLTQAEMPEALAGGMVDAVCTYYPYTEEVIARGGHILFTSLNAPGAIIDMLVTDENTLKSRTEGLAAMTRAYLRAVDYLQKHPDKTIDYIAERQKMDTDTTRKIFTSHVRIVTADEQAEWLDPAGKAAQSANRAVKALKATGFLDEVKQSDFITKEILSALRQD